MPFDPHFDEVYAAILATCRQSELLLSCSRADDFYGAGHIMEDILEGIVHSEYVVADVTHKNPNVFYELGIAHSCKAASKVIILTQSIDDVPFDLRHMRCIVYRPNTAGLDKLKRDLAAALRSDAVDVFRFAVPDNGRYDCDERLSGRNRNFYTFQIIHIWLGRSDAKLTLKLHRHSLDEGSGPLEPEQHCYIRIGEAQVIQPTDWALRLDRIKDREAYFSVLRQHPTR
jgi:hypothetical protein